MASMLPPGGRAPRVDERDLRGPALWAAAVAALLLSPLPASAAMPAALAGIAVDRLLHALLFFGLGISWQLGWRGAAAPGWRAQAGAARAGVAAAVAGYGGLLEVAQGLLGAGRSAEWGDFAADALGAVAAALLAGARGRGAGSAQTAAPDRRL